MAEPEKSLRAALGSFVSGITVITCTDADQNPRGITVSSFCSLSLEPPMLLWCLAKNAGSADTFQNTPRFRVHVLAHDQWPVAELFASRNIDRFKRVDWSLTETGLPALENCAAFFECSRSQVYDGGDHWIFTGLIEDFQASNTEPLAYLRGRYALTHRGEHAESLIALQAW